MRWQNCAVEWSGRLGPSFSSVWPNGRSGSCERRPPLRCVAIVTTVLVVDASAVAEMLLGTAKGRRVAEAVGLEHSLHAPELLSLEMASVLRGLVLTGQIDVPDAEQVIEDLGSLGIEYYEHLVLLPRVFALRDNLTAYDAAYVALAEALGVALLTCDTKIGRAPGHRAAVTLVT